MEITFAQMKPFDKLVIMCFIIAISFPAKGQEVVELNPEVFSGQFHYGFIIPHSSELREISKTNPYGFQIDWGKVRNSQKSWDNCNCYAQTGLSFGYFNYGNPDQLGSSFNLIYFAEPYLNFKKDFFLSFRAGTGVTYLTTVYDKDSNSENTFYSSPISFILLLSLNANYRLNERYGVSVIGNYNHISNGGIKQPNRGMNFPTLSVSISYRPKEIHLPEREKIEDKKGSVNGYTRLFGTLPGVNASDEYPAVRKLLMGISGGVFYHISQLNAMNVGGEFSFDNSVKEKALRSGTGFEKWSAGIVVGHNLIFGRFTFNQQMGLYIIRNTSQKDDKFYQRYELLCNIIDGFQVGVGLKAHGHVADNIDLRLGIIF